MTDRRSDEAKAKKTSFTATKENEKMVDQLKEAQGRNRSASVTDKDIAKMESKLTKIADGVREKRRVMPLASVQISADLYLNLRF